MVVIHKNRPKAPSLTTDLSKYDNSWYTPTGSVVKRAFWYIANVLVMMNPLNPFSGIKVLALRLFGAKVGEGVIIKPRVNVKYPWLLEIGDHCWIGEAAWIDNLVPVSIKNNVCISQGAMLLTGNHNYKKPTFDLMIGEIVLEEGVWIGAQSVVTAGVTCKSHSVLSVNSVAVRDLEAYTIYSGIPCSEIRKRHLSA